MKEPLFLTLAEVIELHRLGVERFGGTPEIRDLALLESALGMPSAGFGGEYLHPGLAAMAGAYLFHLVTNHAFVDGNKRIGALAATTFLLLNDVAFHPSEDEFGDLVLAVARGEATKEQATEFIRRHTKGE